MFIESEFEFKRLEDNKGELKTEQDRINYMEKEIEALKDLVIKLEREIENTRREAMELKYKTNSCYGCKYSNY